MVDTHCHIDDKAYIEDLEEMIIRQQQNGVTAIIVPAVDETSLHPIENLCSRYPNYLYSAFGLHPENIRGDGHEQLSVIEKKVMSSTTLVVAIGEIGLDYHYTTENKDIQKEVFRCQLQWAGQKNLPVIIHCRDAVEDTLNITKEIYQSTKNDIPLSGVLHCFNSSREIAQQWLDMGFYIGIGGVLTFKNCKLSDTLRYIPLDRIVLETDGPYMTPVPMRGKRNESFFIKYVIEKLQSIYDKSFETIETETTLNAQQLFALPVTSWSLKVSKFV